MSPRIAVVGVLVLYGFAALAAVSPSVDLRQEAWGTKQPKSEFKDWLTRSDALITPQTAQLGAQACLRSGSQALDSKAYDLVVGFGAELTRAFERAKCRYGQGLSHLGAVMTAIEEVTAESATHFEIVCAQTVKGLLAEKKDSLFPLFEGRMVPKIPPELAARGVAIAPLTWDDLRDQVCKLEGYYGVSDDKRLWKFFAITRLMGNVLPSEAEDETFTTAFAAQKSLRERLAKLNAYSAIAGKPNGAHIGDTRVDPPVRMTGAGVGSKATSLLATFTTDWRENVQKLVLSRPYPQKPFELLRGQELFTALRPNYCDRCSARTSATELGMLALWDWLHRSTDSDYLQTSLMAWLAMNAEANIRANEKIAGLIRETAVEAPQTNPWVLGDPEAYQRVSRLLEAAEAAYKVIDPDMEASPLCVPQLKAFAAEAAGLAAGAIAHMGGSRVFTTLELNPVIADIGLEVDDRPDTDQFRLHLATGHGRLFETTIDGTAYTRWAPSAFSLHLPAPVSTSEWREGRVHEFDL